MPSQADPPVGRTGARFGRASRDESQPDDRPAARPAEPVAQSRPTGARFGRVARDEPDPEDEQVGYDDRPPPTGARFGGGGRRGNGRATAREDATTGGAVAASSDGASPEPAGAVPPGSPGRPDSGAVPRPAEPGWTDDPGPDPRSAPTVRVRPYVHTGGRTRARTPLPIEALVCAAPGASVTRHHGAHRSVLELCRVPQSVAEVSARLGIPLGVVRVLVDDLFAQRVVTVHGGVGENVPDLALMRRVLAGLHQL